MKSADILADVKKLLQEQMQAVTYKWLARQYGLPANTAKQLLFVFFEQNRKLTKATFLLAGWTKEEPRMHVIRLVDAAKVLAVKETLQPLTSYHAYSVQPSKPQDSAALANSDYVQLEQLFQQLLKAKDSDAVADNCLATNSCSGVSCSAAIRDVTLTKRPSDPAAVAAVAAEKATSAAEAKRGDKLKPSSAPEKPSQPGGGLPAGKASKVTGSTQRAAGSRAASAAGHLSGLWTKAPPKKQTAAASEPAKAVAAGKGRARKTVASVPAADADAALRAVHEEHESSDEDDDDLQPQQRGGRSSMRNSNAMLLDDDDEQQGQDESPAKPAVRPSGTAGRRQLVEDSSDEEVEEVEDAQPPTATSAGAGEGDEIDVDLDMEPAAVEDLKPTGASKGSKANSKRGRKKKADDAAVEDGLQPKNGVTGRVKLNSSAPAGSKRRKVTRTTYNDQGEEVTEVVWEDEAAPETPAAAGSDHMEAQPSAGDDVNGSTALRERQANGVAGSEAAGSKPAKKPSSPPKKGGKAISKATNNKPAGKAGGKGKADPNQRGIMAFFNAK